MNDFMELHRVITIALRRWWLLVALTVVGAVAGYVISRAQTPVYQATTTVLVGESIRSSSVDRVDIQISEALMQTYVEIARRQPVLQAVVTALNLEESWQQLANRVTVGLIDSTQLIEITVEARSPELAETIADELVHQLILLSPSGTESGENQLTGSFNREQIARLQERIVNGQQRLVEIDSALNNSISETELTALQQEKTTLEGLLIEWERNYTQLLTLTESKGDPTQLTIVEPAHSNNRMIRPRIQLNTLLGAGVGMILALGLIFLLELLDDTFRSLKDFSQSEEVNVLGSIRRIRGKNLSDKLIAHLQPHSPITESYRIVRSRIRFKRGEGTARSIMVTSSMPDEGKSLTAANLAVVFAQANFKTIIVDANLRHPVLHEVFAVRNDSGLGDALSSPEIHVKEYLQDTSVNNLQILSSGTPLPDPSGQLGSERMEQIIRDLKESADIVIFDSPPALVFADAIVLSRRVHGVIMVIQAGKSKRSAINQTLLDLQNANADLLGSVFNLSPKSDTFSVNKAYMQERPKVSFAQGLAKKDTQLNNVGGFVPPVSANVEVAEPRGETGGTDAEKLLELDDLATPAHETAEASVSTNGFKPTQIDTSHDKESATDTNDNEPVQLQDLGDSVADVDEQLEESVLESEKVTIDEAPSSDLDVSPMPAGETGEVSDLDDQEARVAVDEAEFHALEDTALPADNDLESYPQNGEAYAKGDENNNRAKRKRHQMSRHNKEFTNEEVPVASSDVPGEQTNE